MLGEQGWLGLFMWLLLHALGLWQMERIRRRESAKHADRDIWMHDLATGLQHAQIIVLVGAAFVGIAYQSFIFLLVAMQCALWSQWQMKRKGAGKAPLSQRLDEARKSTAIPTA